MPIYCENNLGNSLDQIQTDIILYFKYTGFFWSNKIENLEKALHVFLICREKERPMQFYEVFVSP